MNMLASVVTSGASQIGKRIVVFGTEKRGKTTFACGAPSALLIPIEQGFDGVLIPHTPLITDKQQLWALMTEISAACHARKFEFKTIIIDTVTALEALLHRATIALDPAMQTAKKPVTPLTMETAHGGYGKAYQIGDAMFREFLAFCDYIAINFQINSILTCHAFSSKINDPLAGEYDSWDILLHSPKNNKSYGKREIIMQWADVVGFLHEPLIVSKQDGVTRGISGGQGVVLGLERTPAYAAGNRYGMRGTIQIPAPPQCGWNAFAHSMYAARNIDLFNRSI